MPKTKTNKPQNEDLDTDEVPATERYQAAAKIVHHVFGGGTVAETLQVFHLIAEDAEEADLVALTEELSMIRTALSNATFDEVLRLHDYLVEDDDDGPMCEDQSEIEEAIEAARGELEELVGPHEAGNTANLLAFLGA